MLAIITITVSAFLLGFAISAGSGFTLLGIGFAAGIVVIGAILALLVIAGWMMEMKRPLVTERCSRCKYDLAHLDVPRCPECGALLGFKKSAEELGIEREIRLRRRKPAE